jgi:hypothetical protein
MLKWLRLGTEEAGRAMMAQNYHKTTTVLHEELILVVRPLYF